MGSETPEDSPAVFVRRVGNALLRPLALGVFGLVHLLLKKGEIYLTPSNLAPEAVFVDDIVYVFFVLVDLYLLWDMLLVFIPGLRPRAYPKTGEDSDESS